MIGDRGLLGLELGRDFLDLVSSLAFRGELAKDGFEGEYSLLPAVDSLTVVAVEP
jgi:hypothetical protein